MEDISNEKNNDKINIAEMQRTRGSIDAETPGIPNPSALPT